VTFLAHVADRALNRPLLIMPEKLAIIAGVLSGRIGIEGGEFAQLRSDPGLLERLTSAAREGVTPEASRFVGSSQDTDTDTGKTMGTLPYRRTPEGVAIITVTGTLVNRGAWVGASSGTTSYEGIKYQVAKAGADPKVKSIILDLESPGGEAVGAFEAAAAIRAVSSQKPITALVNGMACSAGYALACGANRIITTPTGISGSIGVVLLHADYSGMLGQAGVKPTLIHAGAHKVDGNPYEPLSKDVRSDLQAEVDAFYGLFIDQVALGRKGASAASIRATDARTFMGADAKAVGLADDVGTFEDVLSDLTSQALRQTGTRPVSNTRKTSMDTVFAQADLDRARADGHAAGHTAGLTEGRTAGATEERARIGAILTHDGAKGREALANHFAFKTSIDPESAALALAQAPVAASAPAAASIAARNAETAVLRAREGAGAPQADAPKQAGAVAIEEVAAKVNAESDRARGIRR
jgi:signal peptide peptidase SppA